MTIFAYRATSRVALFVLVADSYLDYLDYDVDVVRKPTPRKMRSGRANNGRHISHF